MAKARITRTYGPIHFEDLESHRFEDLVRELIYDYKDWQSIEATGRTGSDEGIDIRAYERVTESAFPEGEEENPEEQHPMAGNRWMIQCKREKEIGPTKLGKILDEIEAGDAPYGYILAASADFSKKSYDTFREKLIAKGVMEFYLWGKPELEDMLHLPKNDRILFTFFGVSLVSKRRSRATEIRFVVNNKNKLLRILGDDPGPQERVLLRDSKDDKYPFEHKYADFKDRPRWREYPVAEHHPLGVALHMHEHFAYADIKKKEYDYSDFVCRIHRESESHESREERRGHLERVEEFWDELPQRYQANFCRDGLVHYEDMLVIDDKGDARHKFPHIYVDFDARRGPFAGFLQYVKFGRGSIGADRIYGLAGWTRIKIFPKTFPEPKIGRVHLDRLLELDPDTHRQFVNGYQQKGSLVEVDHKHDFLTPRDVIRVAQRSGDQGEPTFVQITHKRTVTLSEYVGERGGEEFYRDELNRRVGGDLKDTDPLTIFEFKRTYHWKFDPDKRLGFAD
jgi:hypothetical protein